MDTEKKFSRGKNYSTEDRNLLLSLVESKKSILECKITNKVNIDSKKEAWTYITNMYNAGTTVPRTTIQLKTLYENIKRRTKKDVAMENKDRYRDRYFPEAVCVVVEETEEENLQQANELRAVGRQEKREIHKTGGGTFVTSLTENDRQIMAILGETVKPMQNPFDDANVYFEDPIPSDKCSSLAINNDDNIPSTSQAITLSKTPSPKQQGKRTPVRRVVKKKIRKHLSPKDRYYLQKLANAKIEAKILNIRLRREYMELRKAV